jgi:hypothetical protein
MSYSFFPHARTYTRERRPVATQPVVSPRSHPVLKTQLCAPDRTKIRLLLITIDQTLQSIDGVARDMFFRKAASDCHGQLQQGVREAEAAMHRLLDLDVPQSHTMIDLSQSLTALILAADILVDGNLADPEAEDICGMLVRNVQQARSHVVQLRASNKLPG